MRERFLKNLLVKYGLEGKISSSYDIIGDILILRKLPLAQVPEETLSNLCQDLIKSIKYVETVYLDEGNIRGEHRVRSLRFLCGYKKSQTLYKENGLLFKVDILNAYISPRLSYEHLRIAKIAKEGETVINMFAGVGIFSIYLAKFSKVGKVYSIDINPAAYRLMLENIKLNKVEDIVVPILGDAGEVVKRSFNRTSDRVLMPLPNLSPTFYCSAISSIKKTGYIHAYEFVHVEKNITKREALERMFTRIKDILISCDISVDVKLDFFRMVRSVGPRWIQGVYDISVNVLD